MTTPRPVPVPVPGDLVAVAVPGLSRPLFGTVVERRAASYRVRVESDRGRATMLCPAEWVSPWYQRPGSRYHAQAS